MNNIQKKLQRVAVVEKIKHRNQKKIPIVFTGNLIKQISNGATKNIVVRNNKGNNTTPSSKDYFLIYL